MTDRDINEPENREFLKETIIQQPLTKGEMIKRTVFGGFVAVIFGGLAAASFTCVKMAMESIAAGRQQETTAAETVAFPGDDPESVLEQVADTAEVVVPVMPEISEEQLNEAVQSVLDTREYTVDDVRAMGAALAKIGTDADKCIVEVSACTNKTDLFGNTVEKKGSCAGAVIAKTKSEYLIFTSLDAARDADYISVNLADGTTIPAEIKQTDTIRRMAVVSVKLKDIPEDKQKNIGVFELGNSYVAKPGDVLITVGSPAGIVHSCSYGNISAVSRGAAVVDGTARIVYLDMNTVPDRSTFLLNIDGELIGWVDNSFASEQSSHVTGVGISDYKAELEKMSNGEPIPFFGIVGQEIGSKLIDGVPESVAPDGTVIPAGQNVIPGGVYVTSVITGGPAYDIGIQDGDIITSFDGVQVTTVRELEVAIERVAVGRNVAVNVMRKGRDEYSSLDYEVIMRAR